MTTTNDTKRKTLDATLMSASVKKGTCSIGVKFDRDDMPLDLADRMLVGAELDVSLVVKGDAKGQTTFDGMSPPATEVAGRCRVGGFRADADDITATLQFAKGAVDYHALTDVGNNSAKAKLVYVGAADAAATAASDPDQAELGE